MKLLAFIFEQPSYKCNDASLNLLVSYVSNRQQVDSGEMSSKPSIVKSGMNHISHITKQLLTSISVDIRIYLPLYTSGLGDLSLFWVDTSIITLGCVNN